MAATMLAIQMLFVVDTKASR